MIRLDQFGVEVGEVDALADDGEGQRAEDDADHRAEAAGQEHAADHDRDDRVEDERHAAGHLRGVVEDRLAHADEGGAGRGEDERVIVSLSVGMPALRALTLSPPMAKIQLP